MSCCITRKTIVTLPINHVVSQVTFRDYLHYFSTLWSLSFMKRCHSTCERNSHPGQEYIDLERDPNLKYLSFMKGCHSTCERNSHPGQEYIDLERDPNLKYLVRKISARSRDGEVYEFLVQDPAFDASKITHELVNKLLNRFKDDWKSALGVFRWAKSHPGYEPLPEFYDKVVDTLGKMRQIEKMRSFVLEMNEDQLVSLNTIAKVMRRFAGAGDWKNAVMTFDDLERFGLEKNTESMNLLLDTLCKESKVEQAREILLKLKSHIPPNAHTFNILIHGWCKIGRIEEAHWTIQEMKGHGYLPTTISYSTIIQFYCHQFNFSSIYELLDEMEEQKCIPNVVTYTTIMHSLSKSNAFDESLQIAERMESAGCKPDTLFYNALLHTLGRAGRVNEAIHKFKVEMPEMGIAPNTSTYNTMIAMFCHHNQEEVALEYLREIENSRHCKPDLQTYVPLLKSCFRAGKRDDCLKILLDDMSSKHHLSFDLSTYALLIHGLSKANRVEEAYELFTRMIAQDIRPRYLTCRLLLEEMRRKNMYDAVQEVEVFMKKLKSS